MDSSPIYQGSSIDQYFSKLSPYTSAETISEAQQKALLPENLLIETQLQGRFPINKLNCLNPHRRQENTSSHLTRFELIEKNIMEYFQTEGVVAGHPQEWKKQYHRKLHKKVSLKVEVSQVIAEKAEEGSSLLSRRLKKKMTIQL